MSNSALTDILTLDTSQIKYQTKRLNHIQHTLIKCLEFYADNIGGSKKKFFIESLANDLGRYFDDVTYDTNIAYDNIKFLNHDFDFSLSIVINFRIMALIELIKLINECTGIVIQQAFEKFENREGANFIDDSRLELLSYQWTDGPKSLELLYRRMNGVFIFDTKESDFIAAFSGRIIGTFMPIRWHEDNASETLYFIKSLMPGLVYEDGPKMSYQRVVGCFVKPDGNLYDTKSLKSLNQRIESKLGQAKRDSIKKLLSEFL